MSSFNMRAIISCVDRLTPVLNAQARQIRAWGRQFEQAGRGAIPMAAGLSAAVLIPARAFMEAESAAIGLKNTLMTSDGLAPGFKKISDIAIELGNQLPGTTADFAHMATVMKANGLATESMINGGLKAAAYLAIATQGLGETYESAAIGITKISNVFNVADKDFVALADTMQRVVGLGVGIEPFTSAMSKAGAALKGVKQSGLGVAKSIAPLIALLVRSGVDPSEAGTGLNKLISVAGGTGKFKNIEGMVAGLEKMYKLNPAKLIEKFKELFGEDHGRKAIVIAAGGYAKITEEMRKQANLNMRVQESLKSLANAWDAATGTFTNAMVAFASSYTPEMNRLAQSINNLAGKMQIWATNNGPVIKTVLEMAAAFVGLKLAIFGVGIALKLMSGLIATDPRLLMLMTLVTLAPVIYDNWGAICSFIKTTWQDSVTSATAIWTNFSNGIMLGITAVSDAFTALLPSSVVSVFSGILDQITAKFTTFIDYIKSGISGIQSVISGISNFFGQTPNGMRPPGYQNIPPIPKAATTVPKVSNVIPMPKAAQSLTIPKVAKSLPMMNVNNVIPMPKAAFNAADFLPQAHSNRPGTSTGPRKSIIQQQKPVQPQQPEPVRGNIDVNFINAPHGLRVTPTKANGPVSITPNVGYRSFAGGSA